MKVYVLFWNLGDDNYGCEVYKNKADAQKEMKRAYESLKADFCFVHDEFVTEDRMEFEDVNGDWFTWYVEEQEVK